LQRCERAAAQFECQTIVQIGVWKMVLMSWNPSARARDAEPRLILAGGW
jgi:hypothetical protein